MLADRRGALALALLALVVQSLALYWPQPPDLGGVDALPGLDKLAHVVLFAVPTWAWLRVYRTPWVPAAMLAQTAASEWIQGAFLPHRGAEVGDVVADVLGVALGVALVTWGPGATRHVSVGKTEPGGKSGQTAAPR